MGNGSGVSRGDRNRNTRPARLRGLVPLSNAIVGIDLADAKQMVAVTDHDSKVLARKTFRCRAWNLGVALDWAAAQAAGEGFSGVTVACEPTGHRWRVVGQLAAQRQMPFVCAADPGLRLAAWRAVWGALRPNPVYAARFAHLTTREHNKLTVTQAQAVIAAAILRHLHAVITTGKPWNPLTATYGTQQHPTDLPVAA